MLDLYSYGWILLPIGIYIIIKEQYSDLFEFFLIMIANLMLALLIFDGWLMHIGTMFLTGFQTCLLLYAAKQKKFAQNDERSINTNSFMRILLAIPLQQLILPVAMMGFWLILRIHTMQNVEIDVTSFSEAINTKNANLPFSDLISQLKGWNLFPFIWLALSLIAMAIANYIKNEEAQCDHKYELYLLKYKISIDVFSLTLNTVYNFNSTLRASDPWQCLEYRNQPPFFKQALHVIIYCGVPFATLFFFYMKKDVFTVGENNHQQDIERIKEMQNLENPFINEQRRQQSS